MAVLGVIFLASFIASFTDWLFFDLLIHRLYQAEPALWRPNSSSRIVVSQIVSIIPTACAVAFAIKLPGAPLFLAAGLWAAGALPIGIHNWQWMRLNPAIAASHALGWLVRTSIATILAVKLL